MDSSTLLNAAIKGDINAMTSLIDNQSDYELLELRVPRLGNSILHLASESGSIQAVKAVLCKQPLLLGKFNSDGNSALHLAARGGHVDIVAALIKCAKKLVVTQEWLQLPESHYYEQIDNEFRREDPFKENEIVIQDMKNGLLKPWQALLQWKNLKADTALHEAVRYNRIQVVNMLLPLDLDFDYGGYLSEELLYMAASRGFDDLVDALIEASPAQSFYIGPYRRTALHGAVICNSKSCTTKLLAWKKSLAEMRDWKSKTALHYAAQLGFVDLVRELINVDASTVYITNREKENVLHVAAKHQQKDVIEYLLEECPALVKSLVIMKDQNGNTPLHLLAASNCFVLKLIHHPMADKSALNNNDETPLELVKNDNNSSLSMIETKSKIAEELTRAGATLYLQKDYHSIDIEYQKKKEKEEELVREQKEKEKKEKKEKKEEDLGRVKRMVDNHMIVAALIATVAFAAGFAMPGGYIQSGSPNQGMVVLSRNSTSFQAFVISDVVALIFSTSALFLYFSSSLYDIYEEKSDKITHRVVVGMCLNMVGLVAIIAAFISGTYSVLQYSHTLAIVTSIIASSIFVLYFIILIKHMLDLKSSRKFIWMSHHD